jgi:beta-glucosidase
MSIDDVIERAIRELDLAAKVELLTGAATFALHGNDAIGLRPMIFSDGPTGVRGSEFVGGERVALFPNATLLAQSWDETAAQRVGEMLAGEGRSQGIDVVLGSTVNLHRSALGGRLFEAYSEDPLGPGTSLHSTARWTAGKGHASAIAAGMDPMSRRPSGSVPAWVGVFGTTGLPNTSVSITPSC